MPSRKTVGTIASAVMTATLPLRSLAKRYNQARSMIFIRGPGRGNSLAFRGSRTGECDRAISADLSAERNFEDGLLSKAYAHCVNMVRRKSAFAGSSGILKEG